jgi:hypothetical protein
VAETWIGVLIVETEGLSEVCVEQNERTVVGIGRVGEQIETAGVGGEIVIGRVERKLGIVLLGGFAA